MGTKVRMKDIAQIAGVSTVTVSKALAGMRGVSEGKRREIMRLADEMGYVPLEKAQAQEEESYRIYVITPDYYYGKLPSIYGHMMDLLSEEIRRAGCVMAREMLSGRMMKEGRLPEGLGSAIKHREADGVLILGELEAEYQRLLPGRCKSPCVFMDSTPLLNHDCVISDGFHGAWQLTNYLFDRGHRRIAYVGTLLASSSITERYLGYARSMMEHGAEILREWQIDDRDLQTGNLSGEFYFRLPRQLPDAFVCNSDLSAAILYEKLKKMGIRCPEDVSIVGFDNFHYPDISPHRFTTYEVDTRKMAHEAVRILLRRIRGDYFRKRTYVIDGHIVEGDSVRTAASENDCAECTKSMH